MSPSDEWIGSEIRRRGLELEYLRELSAALGFEADEPWNPATIAAIEGAPPEVRRRAALRVLSLTEPDPGPVEDADEGSAAEAGTIPGQEADLDASGRTSMSLQAGGQEVATLGGGCFWCTEAVFESLRGVRRVDSGYAGGDVANPSYEQVCSGTTGHAEVVRVTFDPAEISYAEVLRIFFATHDPTTLNRQGADVGTQYRSVIFPHSPEQERVARAVISELENDGVFDAPIVTTVEPEAPFYPAEEYHREYYRRNPRQGYCQVVIAPKMAKFRQQFAERLRASDDPASEG